MLKSTYILNKSMQYTKIINSDTISVISAYLRLRGKAYLSTRVSA